MRKLLISFMLSLFSTFALACDFEDVTFVGDFPMGRLNACEQLAENQYKLSFSPENRPINSSAWYAFSVSSASTRNIQLYLAFDGDMPRYLPKQSTNRKDWQTLPFEIDENQFVLDIEVGPEPTWIAGQELLDNSAYQSWLRQLESNTQTLQDVSFTSIGTSTQNRSIEAIISKAEEVNEWIIFIGRQHPPEVTGALAMLPFVEEVLQQNTLATHFRDRFNLLIIPNLNPDGIELGHWRHNANGVDLNRDWNRFEQKETQVVRNYIDKILNDGGKLVFGLDFHSTQEDVFYTIPSDADVYPKELAIQWLADIHEQTNRFFKVRNKPGNSPGRGIFKQYIADEHQVHGVTFELGDSTDRNVIKNVASISANTFMKRLLETPTSAFEPSKETNK